MYHNEINKNFAAAKLQQKLHICKKKRIFVRFFWCTVYSVRCRVCFSKSKTRRWHLLCLWLSDLIRSFVRAQRPTCSFILRPAGCRTTALQKTRFAYKKSFRFTSLSKTYAACCLTDRNKTYKTLLIAFELCSCALFRLIRLVSKLPDRLNR